MTIDNRLRPQPAIRQSGEGKPLDFGPGREVSVLLDGAQTGGQLTMINELMPPDFGTPLHVHTREDEVFLVEEGEISYYANGVWTAVGPGGAVYFPRGIPHRFRNNGTVPARHRIFITPAGFEHFFVRLAEEVSRPDGPDSARIAALHAEFGMPLVEEQEAK